MPNPLKPKIKQTLVFNMAMEELMRLLQKQFGASWQIESSLIDSDTIGFRASYKDAEILGQLERWQGTESRLHLDAQVLSKIPYETWREWTGVGTFAALIALWILISLLPLTATTFLNLYLIMTSTGSLLMLFLMLILTIFLGFPFLIHRYFNQLSPDIRLYEESLAHLGSFVTELKSLQKLPDRDISRLEDQSEAAPLTANHPSSEQTPSKAKMGHEISGKQA